MAGKGFVIIEDQDFNEGGRNLGKLLDDMGGYLISLPGGYFFELGQERCAIGQYQ